MAIWASTKTCLLAIGRPGGDCTTSLSACEGSLDKVETISDARFVRVSGWLAYSTAPIEAVRLLDAGGREVGYAITGQARPSTAEVAALIGERGLGGDDLVRTLGVEALHAGYRGYSFSNAAGTSAHPQKPIARCDGSADCGREQHQHSFGLALIPGGD